MDHIDIIVIISILLIIGGALAYIIIAKKKGRRCIGCPDSKTCSGNCETCASRKASAAAKDLNLGIGVDASHDEAKK